MKKRIGVLLLFGMFLLSACVQNSAATLSSTSDSSFFSTSSTNSQTTNSELTLTNSTITIDDTTLEFVASGIDETKTTFLYVANRKVLEEKLENGKTYSVDITEIKDAYRTDYRPKVQLVQTEDDQEFGNIVTFKQIRYTVKNS